MTNSSAMRALLLSSDPNFISVFTDVSNELGIKAESREDCHEICKDLNRTRYEAVVLDFDTVSGAGPILATVRESPSNKNAVVFAAATNATNIDQALQGRAHFLLRRPIEIPTMRRTLHAAYDLMVGGRRRYFRCAANLQVTIRLMASGNSFQCSTMNISSNGMAIRNPVPLLPAEMLDISLFLPDATICATGLVIWDDHQGKAGINFQCSDPDMRKKLDSWLDSRFESK